MKNKILVAVAATIFSVGVSFAAGKSLASDNITVNHQTITQEKANSDQTTVFMDIMNNSDNAYLIVAATTPNVKEVQLHTYVTEKGKSHMQQVSTIPVMPHSDRHLQKGGFHVMLMDLQKPLQKGETLPITLIYNDGSHTTVDASVA